MIGKFSLEIKEKDGSFEGTCIDESLKELLHEPILISGFTEDDMISFIKTYPKRYHLERDGSAIMIDNSQGYEVEYNGQFDHQNGYYKGTWQIGIPDPSDPFGDMHYIFGNWMMHREEIEPAELNNAEGQLYEAWRNQVFPYLIVREHEASGDILKKGWLDHLDISYVLGKFTHFEYLSPAILNQYLSTEDIHQYALNNLEFNMPYELIPVGNGCFRIKTNGMFQAEMILHPALWEDLSQQFNDDLIAAIPAKDQLLFAAASNQTALDNLKLTAAELTLRKEALLTSTLFRFDRQSLKWEIFE